MVRARVQSDGVGGEGMPTMADGDPWGAAGGLEDRVSFQLMPAGVEMGDGVIWAL